MILRLTAKLNRRLARGWMNKAERMRIYAAVDPERYRRMGGTTALYEALAKSLRLARRASRDDGMVAQGRDSLITDVIVLMVVSVVLAGVGFLLYLLFAIARALIGG